MHCSYPVLLHTGKQKYVLKEKLSKNHSLKNVLANVRTLRANDRNLQSGNDTNLFLEQ